MRRARFVGAVLSGLLGAGVARAEIPEPDNVLWGAITLANRPITAADTNVIVEARKTADGPVVASYRMGAAPAYGNYYSLRIPIEAFLPLTDPNASRLGGLIYLTVRDSSGVRDERTTSLAARGRFTRLDFIELDSDGDGLPDRWEQQHFGGPTAADPNADPDRDGRSNLAEFLAGTNPRVPDSSHPADDSPADNRITTDELDAYLAAWLIGDDWQTDPTNIPVAYVTRAAYLWLAGETYRFTNSPPTNAPLWWVSTAVPPPAAAGTNHVSSTLPTNHSISLPLLVMLGVAPSESVLVHAVEHEVPSDWTVLEVSHGGFFDEVNRKVKWGPFFDAGARDLYYEAVPPATPGLATFLGTASFDGLDVPIPSRPVALTQAGGLLRFVATAVDALGPRFVLAGQPATSYVLERSTNLVTWSNWQTVTTDANGRWQFRPPGPVQAPHQFYRARSAP